MGKSNTYRSEARVFHLTDTMPAAATTTFTLDLEAGAYNIGIFAKSNLTGTTTTVTIRGFADAARTQVVTEDFRVQRPSDGTAQASLAFPAGASGRSCTVVANVAVTVAQGIPIPHGLQVTVTKGGAATGEVFVLDVICVRQ